MRRHQGPALADVLADPRPVPRGLLHVDRELGGRPDEERCEEEVDRREDALDDRADDDAPSELHIVLGLLIALVLKHTIIQRDRHLARML